MFEEGLGKDHMVLSLQLGISPSLSLHVSLFWKEQDYRNRSSFWNLREMDNFVHFSFAFTVSSNQILLS